jgi:hypothetical protein
MNQELLAYYLLISSCPPIPLAFGFLLCDR